jgi:outer membrane protein OmpA-like peptidoglycan-associated protein
MRVLTFSIWIVGLMALSANVAAQTASQEYYVTIGVFAVQENAIRYTAGANKKGFNAQYAINPARKLYYVYLLQTDDKKKAYAFDIKLRAESEYKEAWVFTGHLGDEAVPVVEVPKKDSVKLEPVIVPVKKDTVIAEPPVVKVDSSTIVKPVVKKKAKGKFFNFKFVNAETGAEVRGEIHLAESNKATQYQAFKANEVVDVPAPKNTAGAYFVTTVAPGYKALEETIHYKDTEPSSSGVGPDGEIIIPISLTRAKRGDYIEFNNVSFYRNSVIMQPSFKDEIDGLIALMKENPNYKVRIHAHCNGAESRDIITLGTSSKYFETDPGNVRKNASAKELTELRAETARRYMDSQGISTERILTKGEGGKMMVYPQSSVYANYNDRLEIEIVRH